MKSDHKVEPQGSLAQEQFNLLIKEKGLILFEFLAEKDGKFTTEACNISHGALVMFNKLLAKGSVNFRIFLEKDVWKRKFRNGKVETIPDDTYQIAIKPNIENTAIEIVIDKKNHAFVAGVQFDVNANNEVRPSKNRLQPKVFLCGDVLFKDGKVVQIVDQSGGFNPLNNIYLIEVQEKRKLNQSEVGLYVLKCQRSMKKVLELVGIPSNTLKFYHEPRTFGPYLHFVPNENTSANTLPPLKGKNFFSRRTKSSSKKEKKSEKKNSKLFPT